MRGYALWVVSVLIYERENSFLELQPRARLVPKSSQKRTQSHPKDLHPGRVGIVSVDERPRLIDRGQKVQNMSHDLGGVGRRTKRESLAYA